MAESKWWILELQETDNGSGAFIAGLLTSIHSIIEFSVVVFGNVEGAVVNQISPDGGPVCYSFNDALPLIRQVVQFDWCDMYCYADPSRMPKVDFGAAPYPDIIKTTPVTVRVWDSGNVEVFTQSKELYHMVVTNHQPLVSHHCSLSEYQYAG